MTREQKSGKGYSKHISMELTADSARVTNLSLEGSRLVLTIEAELEGSHLRSTDDSAAHKAPEPKHQPGPDSSSASAPTLGLAQPGEQEEPGILNMGSENLPPAAAAFTPDRIGTGESVLGTISTPLPQSLAVKPEDISGPDQPDVGPALFERAAVNTIETAPGSCGCCGLEEDTIPVLDTLDPTPYDAMVAGPATPPPLPVTPPIIEEPAAKPSVPETEQDSAPKRWDAPELVSEDSSKDIITHPEPSSEKKTDPASDIQKPPASESAASEPLMDRQLALSEESSAIGGVRHGEPQPAISFGQDLSEQTDAAPPVSETASVPPPIPPPMPSVPEKPAHTPEEGTKPEQADEAKKEQEKPSDPKEKSPETEEPAKPKTDGEQAAEKPSGGGTTVLIRYTCPKCKTQGMQAVDKVGTVVNCSNCGKAMRLVMKK